MTLDDHQRWHVFKRLERIIDEVPQYDRLIDEDAHSSFFYKSVRQHLLAVEEQLLYCGVDERSRDRVFRSILFGSNDPPDVINERIREQRVRRHEAMEIARRNLATTIDVSNLYKWKGDDDPS